MVLSLYINYSLCSLSSLCVTLVLSLSLAVLHSTVAVVTVNRLAMTTARRLCNRDAPSSQVVPAQPGGQSQEKDPNELVHVPPLLHGTASHSLTSVEGEECKSLRSVVWKSSKHCCCPHAMHFCQEEEMQMRKLAT